MGVNAPEELDKTLTNMMNDDDKQDHIENWQHQALLFSLTRVRVDRDSYN